MKTISTASLPTVTFREIEFGSDDFRKEIELRNKVLRLPLGLNLYNEDISQEKRQMHFGLFDPYRNLVACVVAVTFSSSETRIRQMAVSREHRSKGHGRTIIQSLEDHLTRRGVTHILMHARIIAVGFYEKLGYATVGREFIEVGIPHIRMEKHGQLGSVKASDRMP